MQLGDQVYYIVIKRLPQNWILPPHDFDGFHIEWATVISINEDTFLLEKPGWICSEKIVKKRGDLFSSRAEVYAKLFEKGK